MRHDQDVAARAQLGCDARMPERQHALERVLQRLAGGQLLRIDSCVAGIETGVAPVVRAEGRGRDVVAAAPDLHLGLPVLRHRLRLVEALQRAIVALVQTPGALHRYPHAVHLIEHDPQGADGALQHRGEGDVRGEVLLEQLLSCLDRFDTSLGREIDVRPAGEEVLEIPDALAVADQDQLAGHDHPASLRSASTPTVSVAKSLASAARMSAIVRCQCARSFPPDSIQAVTRAGALPRSLRASTRSARRRCTRSAPSRRPVRATACHGPSTASPSIRDWSQSQPMRVPTSKYTRAVSATLTLWAAATSTISSAALSGSSAAMRVASAGGSPASV